jgi:myo-inositol-hexaphosphate 3-phosphohydrolase
MYVDFMNVQVGDEVKVTRGRQRDRISRVYHVTAATFDVEGFGRFWKKNGKGYGDAQSWYGRWAENLEHGDKTRIAAEQKRVNDHNIYNGHRVRDFNDDELARVAAIILECNKRRNLKAEQDAEEDAATEAAAQ